MAKLSKKAQSNILFLITTIIWGMAFVAQCTVAGKIDLFLFLGARYFLGALSLVPVILIFTKKGQKTKNLLAGVVCGVVLFTASALQQYGINLSPNAGKAGFITGIYTVLVPIFYFLFFRKKTGINVCYGAVLAVLGLYVLSVQNGINSIEKADIIIFLGAIMWAIHIIAIDFFVKKANPIKLSFYQFLTCGVLGVLIAFCVTGVNVTEAVTGLSGILPSLLYVGVLSSGVAYTTQALGQKNADPTYSAIILSGEAVFAAIGGAIFGIDKMSLRSYVGCFIIFSGIILSQLNIKQKKN